jgi:hypothetical protein
MVGISSSYNYEIVAYKTEADELFVEGRNRKLNRSASIFGPTVGFYRMSTGSLDMIYGLFTLHSELFFQGTYNLVRGSLESMVVLIPLAIALSQRHTIQQLTFPVLKEVSLELMAKAYELCTKHFIAMATTYVVGNLICQAPLMIFDRFMLNYHLFCIRRIACDDNNAELYHDLDLIKTGTPMGLFYDYDCNGKINDLEVYGLVPNEEI